MRAHAIVSATRVGRAAFDRLLSGFSACPPAFVQLREKEMNDRDLLALAIAARAALPPATALLVNGRPDVAVAAGAQGIQLPADGLPLADVRRAFPGSFVVGVSCHALEEVEHAAKGGADFALLAPIYAPTSKPGDVRPPLGPAFLDALRNPPPLALHVLGGITPERLAAWPATRLRRVTAAAGIGLFERAADPAAVVRALAALEGA